MNVEIRRLYAGDDALVKRIAEDVFDEPVRPDRLSAYLASPGHFMIVALVDGVVVGQCAAVIHRHPDKPSELYVDELGVSPAWQRRGIGAGLMRRILKEGRARGCEEAWLGTEPDNDAANALYAGLEGSPVETFHLYHYDL